MEEEVACTCGVVPETQNMSSSTAPSHTTNHTPPVLDGLPDSLEEDMFCVFRYHPTGACYFLLHCWG